MLEELVDQRDRSGNRMFRCQCDCGNEVTVASFGYGGGGSCGCLSRESWAKNMRILRKAPGEASFTWLLKGYRAQAVRRELEWTITTDVFRRLTSTNCHWCGKAPEMFVRRKFRGVQVMNGLYLYNGLDRVDSTRGYHEDNVVPACKICNRMKNALTVDEFRDHILKILGHRGWSCS